MLPAMFRRAFFASMLSLLTGVAPPEARALEASPATPPPVSGSGGKFELVTYNVAGLPEGISGSHPLANLPRIGELLNGFDIALVQEDFAYPLELRRRMRHPHASAAFVREGLDFGDGLSQFSRLPFSDFRRVAWSSCHGLVDSFFDCLTPKGFSLSRQSLAPGVFVHVYNLHMDAGWSADDRAARAGQVEQLLATLAGTSADQAVIVAGDTNLRGRDHALLQRFRSEAGLRDACAETRCPEPWRVDRVLYRGSAAVQLWPRGWRIASQFVDGAQRPLSDHLPVAVQFEWRHESRGAVTGAVDVVRGLHTRGSFADVLLVWNRDQCLRSAGHG
jgi:endonuclease/exonuclease/phosphatase family metal-dependent hydrolase